MEGLVSFLITNLIALLIMLSIVIPISISNRKYKRFVIEHSKALKNLKIINQKYSFKKVKNYDGKHSYDNENFYDNISTQDYLTYELINYKKKVLAAIDAARYNKRIIDSYNEDIKNECKFGSFDTDELLKSKRKLARYEKNLFKSETKKPKTSFSIYIELILTKINGRVVRRKYRTFSTDEIRSIIDRLNNNQDGFYKDEDIWESICRVERGKVTNKLRFSIYRRDGWRCCKCRRKTGDLEIDHIVPIAKGGKTTYNNLQTLCRRCNKEKGTKTIRF